MGDCPVSPSGRVSLEGYPGPGKAPRAPSRSWGRTRETRMQERPMHAVDTGKEGQAGGERPRLLIRKKPQRISRPGPPQWCSGRKAIPSGSPIWVQAHERRTGDSTGRVAPIRARWARMRMSTQPANARSGDKHQAVVEQPYRKRTGIPAGPPGSKAAPAGRRDQYRSPWSP